MAQKIIYKQGDIIGDHKVVYVSAIELSYIWGYTPKRMCEFICPLCAKIFISPIVDIKRGKTVSCGCSKRIHGLSGHQYYGIWVGIKSRCYHKNNISYENYGGRGICMDKSFLDVAAFIEYIERLPKKEGQCTIDRIDNNSNYMPGNIQWASYSEQSQNKRPDKDSKNIYYTRGKWNVRFKYKYKRHYIGDYATYELARAARNAYIIANNWPHKII